MEEADGNNGTPAKGRMEGKTMAAKNGPVQVTARELITVLRQEAAAFSPNKHLRNLMADIAARDMMSNGRVRIVQQGFHRAA